jgi:hypothetical protein
MPDLGIYGDSFPLVGNDVFQIVDQPFGNFMQNHASLTNLFKKRNLWIAP